jgi:S-adenosylmethionine synthetase
MSCCRRKGGEDAGKTRLYYRVAGLSAVHGDDGVIAKGARRPVLRRSYYLIVVK